MRRSAILRSSTISVLPVPLNSSKITSSMREPVSTRAVAMMVSEPPSSMLRAAPKKRLGRCSAFASTPPERTLPEDGHDRVVGAGQAGDRVEQDHHVALVLDQALGLLDHHLRDLHVAGGGLVEGGGDHLALHRALHVRHLLGPLVDEQHDEDHLGVVGRDRVGDVLQDHGLAGAGGGHDQAALALALRGHHVEDARGHVLGRRLEPEPLAAGRAGSGCRRGPCPSPPRAGSKLIASTLMSAK